MTVDQAIDRYSNNAEYELRNGNLHGYMEFRQLAEWLKDYKRLLEQEPCDDVVNRQAVVNAIKYAQVNFTINSTINFANYTKEVQEIVDNILSAQIKAINELPPVRPQEQTGHWIMNRQLERRTCDNCHAEYWWSFYPHNYCPNCGCAMKGD